MKALLINCSPVRHGATAQIAAIAQNRLSSRYEVQSVCIDDYQIQLCKGCRTCHQTAKCVMTDDTTKLIDAMDRADVIVCIAPSYWADVPGQFKVFIDRCTPWCDTHTPYASIRPGKQGYAIALRTGPNIKECERLIATIEHFYGHLHIAARGSFGLCGVSCKEEALARTSEIEAFCDRIIDQVVNA